MAKQQLPTNFKDDVLDAQMVGKRRYRVIQNEDGTISLEDVTNYSQIGSNFGAAQTNATNLAVNESFDKNKVIDSLDDIAANESAGYAAGALAVRELNGNSYELHSDGYKHYKKYNNGMLEVWGLVSVSYTNGLGKIVFPDDYCFVDYSSYTLFVSPAYVDSDNAFEIMSTQKMSGKLANVYSRKYPGLSDKLPTHDCDFYAIGRWK